MTIYRGRPFSPVESQMDLMKSHVTRGVPEATRTAGERTLQLAVPAGWTAQARCIPDPSLELHERKRIYGLYDEVERITRPGKAISLCEGCPVLAQCLSAAMEEERGLSAGGRYGIRGGLSPKERADLAFAERECERGHSGRWAEKVGAGKPRCLECLAEDARARYEAQRLDPGFRARMSERNRLHRDLRRVSCLLCKTTMLSASLKRHMETRHPSIEESEAA